MTRVTLKFTGDVWSRLGTYRIDFTFAGQTLGELLRAFFVEYPVRDLILDEQDRVIPYSRIIVDGHFLQVTGDMNLAIQDGSEVVLIHPFLML
jgi:molybdopterin converting factor small subunit